MINAAILLIPDQDCMHLKSSHRNFITGIRKAVGKAINQHGLIDAGEKILVAMSGGKDSLVLLDTLTERLRYLPICYEVFAVHVSISNLPMKVDTNYLMEFCHDRNVELFIRNIKIDMDFSEIKSYCFFCAWNRRKVLFDMVKELGCHRLALGHHMDDIIETLLMSMCMNGRISSMPIKLSMFDGEFSIIRPLCFISEKEIKRYCRLKGFKTEVDECPYARDSKRQVFKEIIHHLEKTSPRIRKNLFNSMWNIDKKYLP